jgi:hypothetical protein
MLYLAYKLNCEGMSSGAIVKQQPLSVSSLTSDKQDL